MKDSTADNIFNTVVVAVVAAIIWLVLYTAHIIGEQNQARRWDVTIETTSGTTTYKQVRELNILAFSTQFTTSNGEAVIVKPISISSKETTGYVEK